MHVFQIKHVWQCNLGVKAIAYHATGPWFDYLNHFKSSDIEKRLKYNPIFSAGRSNGIQDYKLILGLS